MGTPTLSKVTLFADVGLILNDDVPLKLPLFDQGLRHSGGRFLIYMPKLQNL